MIPYLNHDFFLLKISEVCYFFLAFRVSSRKLLAICFLTQVFCAFQKHRSVWLSWCDIHFREMWGTRHRLNWMEGTLSPLGSTQGPEVNVVLLFLEQKTSDFLLILTITAWGWEGRLQEVWPWEFLSAHPNFPMQPLTDNQSFTSLAKTRVCKNPAMTVPPHSNFFNRRLWMHNKANFMKSLRCLKLKTDFEMAEIILSNTPKRWIWSP